MHNLESTSIDGIDHYVLRNVPVVRSMVMNRAMLPLDELEKTHEAWNMKPVVFGHPKQGANLLSAAEEDLLHTHVGFVTNSKIDGDRMRADLFLKKDKIDKSHDGLRLLNNLKEGKQVDVSTGYFDRSQFVRGVKDGKEFERVQHDIAPDHLAILLDEDGACACRDGCGINVNNNKAKGVQTMSDENQTPENAEAPEATITANAEALATELKADAIAIICAEVEKRLMEANAAMPAGSTQNFDTCMKAIDDLKNRLGKIEGTGKEVNANGDEGEDEVDANKAKKKKVVKKKEDEESKDDKKSMSGNAHTAMVEVPAEVVSEKSFTANASSSFKRQSFYESFNTQGAK